MQSALLIGLPVLLVAGFIAWIYFRKADRPANYTLSQPWTSAPVLWSATDEAIPGDGHGSDGHGGVLNVGGGASGGW